MEESERRIQEEIDQAWREHHEALNAKPCLICGHPVGHHYSDGCDDCPDGYLCGDPDYDSGVDREEEFTEVWFTEPPGGHRGYE